MAYNNEWLALEKSLGSRPAFSGTLTEIRQQFESLGSLLGPLFPPPDPQLTVSDKATTSGLKVRIYQPKTTASMESKLPVGVYYHGGGFVLGNLETEDADCRYFAQNTPCIIVAVDYRLAPDHKFEAILNDAVEGYEWAWENSEKFGGDRTHVFTIGASAGGCLSLAVANNMVQQGKRSKVSGVIAMCPITTQSDHVPEEYRQIYRSHTEHERDAPVLNKQACDVFFQAAQLIDPNPAHFVIYSDHLKHFPRTWIATCEMDPLRDDGVALEKSLQRHGVEVQRKHYYGFGHVFWIFPQLEARAVLLADVVEGIRFTLHN